MTLTTTFRKLRTAGACAGRYKFLRAALKGVEDDDPINLLTILETNGIDDALWALNATVENCDQVARLMAADFAETALPIWRKHYPDDKRPELAIQAARDFAYARITAQQRDAAGAAAWAAAGDAAGDAARAAARDAAWDAARAAARAAARDAARDAAWAAAGAAAGAAAWAAAVDAARAAARAAAGAAAWAAAGDAAWAAARERNRQIFISHLQPVPVEAHI